MILLSNKFHIVIRGADLQHTVLLLHLHIGITSDRHEVRLTGFIIMLAANDCLVFCFNGRILFAFYYLNTLWLHTITLHTKAAYQPGRGAVEHIFALSQVIEKSVQHTCIHSFYWLHQKLLIASSSDSFGKFYTNHPLILDTAIF